MSGPLIDTNVSLFRWPFRRLPDDEPAALAGRLREQGVTAAWAGSFEGLLHNDITGVNERLAAVCAETPLFVPFGSINPLLPDWELDLRRCREEHKMKGIRLHPNYHGYRLDSPVFAALLRSATEMGFLIQIAIIMEDERTLHPLMRLPPVDVKPLPPLLRELPKVRLMLINAFRTLRLEEARRLAGAGNVAFEISMLEGVGGIRNLLQQVPVERVLFGSHAPFFYFESAALKLKESALTEDELGLVQSGNALKKLMVVG
jgi:predicted TIM-barrel fold metal-dependent hydrolase